MKASGPIRGPMSDGSDAIEPDDPRLRVAEAALDRMAKVFEHKLVQRQALPHARCQDACEKGLSALRSLKYSYATPDALREMSQFETLTGLADTLLDQLGGEDWHEDVEETALGIARVRWGVAVLQGLPDRLTLPETGLEAGVDARVGGVVTARQHPHADDLRVLRVAAGRGFDVVTNDETVDADDRVGLALLPPTEIAGTVSEGMLLGLPGGGVLTGVTEGDRGRPDVPDDAWAETRNVLDEFLD